MCCKISEKNTMQTSKIHSDRNNSNISKRINSVRQVYSKNQTGLPISSDILALKTYH